NVERVIFKTFSNNDTMYLALSHGELDMLYTYSMGITPIAIETLSKNENITLQAITATNAPAVLGFNNSIAPFNDINMRQAVKYAIDYDKFKELFSSKYGSTPQEGFVSKGLVGYVETAPLKRDLQKAKEYLKLCGYDDSDLVNGYHTKNGKKLSFVLTVNGGKETHVRYGELVKQNLKEIGIDVVLEAIDNNAYKAKTSNKFSANNPTHQASIFGYTAAGMSMMSGLGTIYIDGTHTVQGGAQVFDSEFKQIVTKMSKSKTLDEYKTYAKECVEYYAKNVPVIALFLDSSVQAYNKKLSGFVVDGNYGLLNYKTWYTVEMAK
ncbi:MAG: ABC transporter substrate-binding protein, partial [Clostridia bacterium]